VDEERIEEVSKARIGVVVTETDDLVVKSGIRRVTNGRLGLEVMA
jgi:F420-0:gamma-glutamyl ligase